jgi:putative endopeptidase
MSRFRALMLCATFIAGAGAAETPLSSGIDLQYFDPAVRAQDDFYLHVNGKWLATTQIPSDKFSFGSFDKLVDEVEEQLRGIVEGLQTSANPANSNAQRIADLYGSFMDETTLERAGLKPLKIELARVEALSRKSQIPALIAHFNRIGVPAPYTPQVHLDAKDATRYVFDLGQDGLGMPDRDYYLQDDVKLKQIRGLYVEHIAKMLRLAGDHKATKEAQDILALETAVARLQWTKTEVRDPVKAYNKVEIAQLAALAPGYNWKAYLTESGVQGKTDYLVISQPSYITGLSHLVDSTPLTVWRSYFRWHLLNSFAPYLNQAIVAEAFAFDGTAVSGTPLNKQRWRRGLDLVNSAMGEALGQLYVERYFPPDAKARMDQLVRNLMTAYAIDIDTLSWMGPETKRKAKEKLGLITVKIGYPVTWRDYSRLKIVPGELVEDVIRAESFDYERNLNKLGQPIDRTEWDMSPQTVNAYYDPEKNEIVFPAAILRPPFFNVAADDAVNYGSIGAVIGHEISHGFDDQGSQYDGHGNLLQPPGWFTTEDLEQFKARTAALVKQYSAYSPVPGYPVNGELTLGENIADNSGLAIAYKAYRLSLAGATAPMLDGLSGDQRFFSGWAQVWRGKTRDEQAIKWIKADPHSPDQFRGLIPEMNQAAFDEAFDVRPGDRMYLAPDQRVTLW